MAAPPDSSITCAISGAFILFSSKPALILIVSGLSSASAIFSTILPTSTGSFIRAEPSPLLTTFGTGHPILTSIISNSLSESLFAISAMISGSEPKSCNASGLSSGTVFIRSSVFLLLYSTALALTISVHISPQPCSLHKSRNGRSVTPAIGANAILFFISTFPILIITPCLRRIP